MNTPPPSNRRFDADELIAVVVALAAIGGILFWGVRRVDPGGGWNILASGLESEVDSDDSLPYRSETVSEDDDILSLTRPSPSTTEEPELDRVRSPQSRVATNSSPGAVSPRSTELETSGVAATDAATDELAESTPSTVDSDPDSVAADPAESTPPTTPAPDDGAATPDTMPTSEISFPDVSTDYWAYPFITGLAANETVRGFQDGTFQPEAATTRAQFAAALQDTFDLGEPPSIDAFSDISSDYWANDAIDASVQSDFLSGYPDDTFRPTEPISRLEVLLSLVSGLQLQTPENPQEILAVYPDAADIPDYAVPAIAAATASKLVILPPGQTQFQPDSVATRAEVASNLYQALAFQGKVESIDSETIVEP